MSFQLLLLKLRIWFQFNLFTTIINETLLPQGSGVSYRFKEDRYFVDTHEPVVLGVVDDIYALDEVFSLRNWALDWLCSEGDAFTVEMVVSLALDRHRLNVIVYHQVYG